MSETIRAGLIVRLLTTPLSALLRGQVTGRRFDPKGRAARAATEAAALPPAARELINRVVLQTKLWHGERRDVAAELRAHFADGLAAGESADEMIASFGDERQAARLIRRAKIRNRPLIWRAKRFAFRLMAVFILVYAALAVRFFVGRPTVTIDYLARLNMPIEQTPVDQRAWPLYERAVNDFGVPGVSAGHVTDERALLDQFSTMIAARPGGARWAELTAWIDSRPVQLELVRQAAARQALGYVLTPNYSQSAELGSPPPLTQTLLPTLNRLRKLAECLSADMRVAAARGDANRVVRDFETLLRMADHLRGPFLICKLVGLTIDGIALQAIDETLSQSPTLLDDASLLRVAHRLAELDERKLMVDLSGERLAFYDSIQRVYTDDGHGNGRLTSDGVWTLSYLQAGDFPLGHNVGTWPITPFHVAAPFGLIASRQEQLAEYDRLMNAAEVQLRRPARDADLSVVLNRIHEIRTSPIEFTKYLPISCLIPSYVGGAMSCVERALGQRDGLTVGIALELYRRRHNGVYPASLDELVPGLLPTVPADRITGDPVRYRLIDGKPLIYSVGVDRDDDGGRPPLRRDGKPFNYPAAAQWPNLHQTNLAPMPATTASPFDGDWVLYPTPPEPPEEK